MVTVYSADLVVPMTAPPLLDGAVAVYDGRIIHVGTRAWVLDHLLDDGRAIVERHLDGVLTPGLVNAHTHLQYSRMGEIGRGRYTGFDDWAVAFSAVYDRGDQDWRGAAAEGARALLAAGVTVVADIVTDVGAVSALADAGLHGIAYWEVMNWSNSAWRRGGRDRVIADLERVPVSPGSGLSPHAPYSLDAEPLLDIPDIVRAHGGRLHIHLGESHFEGARAGATDWHFARVESYRALLRARGTSVALCPRSNEVIGLEAPPVAAYLREGSPIAVGTDSLSSSPSLDPMADIAALARIARGQGYTGADLHERLLSAATFGGARALGIDIGPDRLGHLAVGAVADLTGFPMAVGAVPDALAELVEAAPPDRTAVVDGAVRYGENVWQGLA